MHNALFHYLIGEKWNEITVSNREPNYGLNVRILNQCELFCLCRVGGGRFQT